MPILLPFSWNQIPRASISKLIAPSAVFFVALQFSTTTPLNAGSLVYTSVVVILPLGCLVAQRIADPSAFDSSAGHSESARVNSRNPDDRFEAASSIKKSLLNGTWSQSDKDSLVFPGAGGRRGSSNALAGRSSKTGVTSTITGGAGYKSGGGHLSALDIELARIDADLEVGQVRVDHEIRQEVL